MEGCVKLLNGTEPKREFPLLDRGLVVALAGEE